MNSFINTLKQQVHLIKPTKIKHTLYSLYSLQQKKYRKIEINSQKLIL